MVAKKVEKKSGRGNRERLTFFIDEDLRERVKVIAKNEGQPESDVVPLFLRQALDMFKDREEAEAEAPRLRRWLDRSRKGEAP